jgi:hypothetical protein
VLVICGAGVAGLFHVQETGPLVQLAEIVADCPVVIDGLFGVQTGGPDGAATAMVTMLLADPKPTAALVAATKYL